MLFKEINCLPRKFLVTLDLHFVHTKLLKVIMETIKVGNQDRKFQNCHVGLNI